MKPAQFRTTHKRSFAAPALMLFLLTLLAALTLGRSAGAATTPVSLATTAGYAVLAGTAITNPVDSPSGLHWLRQAPID